MNTSANNTAVREPPFAWFGKEERRLAHSIILGTTQKGRALGQGKRDRLGKCHKLPQSLLDKRDRGSRVQVALLILSY